MQDKTYYKEQRQKKELQQTYRKYQDLCKLLRKKRQQSVSWEDNALYGSLLKIAEKNRLTSLEDAAYLLAKKEVANVSVGQGLMEDVAVKVKQKEILDTIFGISKEERQKIKEDVLKKGFQDKSVEKVLILGKLDEKTCGTCRKSFGMLYPLDEIPIPHHPNCRCVVSGSGGLEGFMVGQILGQSKSGIAKVSFGDGLHLFLDIAGLIPALGNIADGLNAFVYITEEDYVNAALSGVSLIPFLGMVSGGTKIVKDSVKVVDTSKDLAKDLGKAGKTLSKVEVVEYGKHFDVTGKSKKLKPNIEYTDALGYKYTTNSDGNICQVQGKLKLQKGKLKAYAQRKVGGKDRRKGDDGGHLIARRFGGSGDIDNLVPQNSKLNRAGGKWYEMEQQWAKALKEGKTVEVEMSMDYPANSSRPSGFTVNYWIDGNKFKKSFENN